MGKQATGAEVAGVPGFLFATESQNIGAQESLQEGQVREQMTQQRMAAAQQSINRNKQLETVLANANAQAAARGISTASGSFKAIQEESIQKGITADRVGQLNLDLKERALRSKMDEIHLKASADRFSSLLDVGKLTMTAAGL